jgi:hypothetical protein
MAPAVKTYIKPHPVDVRPLRPYTVMEIANALTQLVKDLTNTVRRMPMKYVKPK